MTGSFRWLLGLVLAGVMATHSALAVVVIPDFGDLNCDGDSDVLDVQLAILSALGLPLNPIIDSDLNGEVDTCDDYLDAISGNCAVGQVIKWDGSLWVCADDGVGATEPGPPGTPGTPGPDGKTSLIEAQVAGSTDCANGGTLLYIGVDADGNGAISTAELANTVPVCNGAPGAPGADGPPGPAGFLADGTSPGQTAYWDGNAWKIDGTLSNTGAGVGVQVPLNHPSAVLEVASTSQGFLMPRMTGAQRDAIPSPAPGLMLFNLTTGCFNHWSGAVWKEMCASCEAPFKTPGITGDSQVDCGASGVTYSAEAIAGVNAYTWTIPPGATLLSGQGTSQITVDFNDSPSGTVGVVASGECPNSQAGALPVEVKGANGSKTFGFTGSAQTFVVPSCVNYLDVLVRGAQGGNSNYGDGGLGGEVTATLAVTPGQVLYVYVGSQPTATGSNAAGGWNGGGNASTAPLVSGGGGASDIRTMGGEWNNEVGLNSRLLVAAGGGGRASKDADKRGGGLTSYGPYPATQSGAGQNGGFGKGGNALYCGCGYYSAGGGGGWYGGGSYGNAGTQSGSGGSSYYGGPGVSDATTTPGVQVGNGTVTLSW